MTPLTVTAVIEGPVIGYDRHPIMLDAPLAWAAWVDTHAKGDSPPPITPTFAYDFPLPLARHEIGSTWIWCTSRAQVAVLADSSAQIRRKPAIEAMARFGSERRHHSGLGPTKARDTTIAIQMIDTITWQCLVTDRAELERLLEMVTHLGARHRNDFGRVQEWRVSAGPPDGWRDRPIPHPDGHTLMGVRAPYWHPSRKELCL